MKHIGKIFISTASVILVASCSLDTIPSDRYTVETFWQSAEGTEAAMTGCYNVLTHSGALNIDPLLEDSATPNEYNYSNSHGWNEIALGTHSANSAGVISDRWKACYEGIGRCNTHLDRLPGAEASEERKLQMEGEAKFLRALYYYLLVTYYNGVPLVLSIPEMSHGALPRSSREEVVSQIIGDLDRAAECLDWKWGSKSDKGRATKGAAMSLKARLLLFEASPLVNERVISPCGKRLRMRLLRLWTMRKKPVMTSSRIIGNYSFRQMNTVVSVFSMWSIRRQRTHL